MSDATRIYKPTRWQLLLECIQRELTYIPLAAAALLVMAAPAWEPTWLLAPLLFSAGGAHFIYDFLMGEEVRDALQARMKKKDEERREEEIGQLRSKLPEGDAAAVLAIRALEKALMDKIRDNQKSLELSGTFSHAYADMVRSVADSAIGALRRKRSLLDTAAQLSELKADEDANTLCEQIPELDNRIDQARETLQEALTQLTLMESEQDTAQISNLGGALSERLKVAARIAHEVSAAQMAAAQADTVAGATVAGAAVDREARPRERKKTR